MPAWFGRRITAAVLPLLLYSLVANAEVAPSQVPLQLMLAAGRQGTLPGVNITRWDELQQLYEQRGWQLLWSDAQGEALVERRRQLSAWIGLSYDHGLDPRDYGLGRLTLPEAAVTSQPAPGLSSEALLNDLLMSHAFMQLALDLSGSRWDMSRIDPLWRLPPKTLDPIALLQQLDQGLSVDQLLNGLLPAADEYRRMVKLYRSLAGEAQQDYQPPILPDGLLRVGDRRAEVAELRNWLIGEGLLNAADSSFEGADLYTAAVADAVRRYQQQQGLKDDGIFGPDTRGRMQLSPTDRLQQVRANLMRWRALPQPLGERYLLVRTAAFNLDLVEQGQLVQRHAIISGRPGRPSLSFMAEVDRLILNPPWTVPFRLAVEDLVPKQRRDPGYFDRLGIEVLQRQDGQWRPIPSASVDWSAVNRGNFNYLLRQRPGPLNSLGQIRFGMANPHSIFLHDTPQQSLFESPSRAFSSGCIRVQEIEQLAQILLGDESLEAAMTGEQTRYRALEASLPVYLVYLTAWVDESGQAYYHPDIYGLDARLIEAVGAPPDMPAAEVVQLAQKLLKK